ncbi:hypothetical protein [Frondihabitans sp. PAMC 28766]|uniref:hypothetical protein n=1 Tax=Frondihabitans sp. PAMC 28766 TaxID=1795630 RepID=UPI0012FF6FD5|nr:hypothetical protein [Frondihabitans sp. PAMC 28766]
MVGAIDEHLRSPCGRRAFGIVEHQPNRLDVDAIVCLQQRFGQDSNAVTADHSRRGHCSLDQAGAGFGATPRLVRDQSRAGRGVAFDPGFWHADSSYRR